ncbi:MAG: cysteine desulfurase family protein [Candidatus Sericytochromatia bacterium]|nr:cysteine desulfurase family protein [Candidatus Sericytochromatia bacterium]
MRERTVRNRRSRGRIWYLDGHATTPVADEVLTAMLPWFSERFGNPSSDGHAWGWEARGGLDAARERLAGLMAVEPREVVFTSGATEANHLALMGVLEAAGPGARLICQPTEHASVLEVAERWARAGGTVTMLPVDGQGRVAPEALEAALRQPAALVSVMAANNEIGTLQPLASLGHICRAAGVPLHADAAQVPGRLPLADVAPHVAMLSLSAHKAYGPKGVGVLMVRRRGPRVRLEPQVPGGGQEWGRRGGTVPVALVVGMAAALVRAEAGVAAWTTASRRAAALLRRRIEIACPGVTWLGHPEERLPGHLAFVLPDRTATDLMRACPELGLSSGAACHAGAPSHVMRALGYATEEAARMIRLGWGPHLDDKDPARVARVLERGLGGRSAR